MENFLKSEFGTEKPVIGLVHFLPLPGSGLYKGKSLEKILEYSMKDAKELEEGGMDVLEMENYGDMTYANGKVGPETVASMTYFTKEISKEVNLPFGICTLTDPFAAMAIAKATGAKFVRATIFIEAVMDASGIIEGCAHELLRYRKLINAEKVKIFADVQVKHSVPLATKSIEDSTRDAIYFQADGLIVTGSHTGYATPLEVVRKVKDIAAKHAPRIGRPSNIPVFVGSGVTKENITTLLEYADGAIVGSSLKVDGVTTNPVDPNRVRDLMKLVRKFRGEK